MIGMHTYVEHPCNQMQHWRIKAQHDRLFELCTLCTYQEDSSTISISKMKKNWSYVLDGSIINDEVVNVREWGNHVLLVVELIIILFIEAT
jgi:hypothetical protein